jgi:hypothetical protein
LPKSQGRIPQENRAVLFCSDKNFDLRETALALQPVATALVRNEYHKTVNGEKDWSYEGGGFDLAVALNFIAEWAPPIIKELVRKERGALESKLGKHWIQALNLGLITINQTAKKNINTLLIKQIEVEENFLSAICEEHDELRRNLLTEWDRNQKDWLELVSPSRRALDYQAIKPLLANLRNIRLSARQISTYRQTFDSVQIAANAIKCLDGETTNNDLVEVLSLLMDTAKRIKGIDLWPVDSAWSSNQLIRRAQNLIDNADTSITVKKLSGWLELEEHEKIFQVNQLDGVLVTNLKELFLTWSDISSLVLEQIDEDGSPDEEELNSLMAKVSEELLILQSSLNSSAEVLNEQS